LAQQKIQQVTITVAERDQQIRDLKSQRDALFRELRTKKPSEQSKIKQDSQLSFQSIKSQQSSFARNPFEERMLKNS